MYSLLQMPPGLYYKIFSGKWLTTVPVSHKRTTKLFKPCSCHNQNQNTCIHHPRNTPFHTHTKHNKKLNSTTTQKQKRLTPQDSSPHPQASNTLFFFNGSITSQANAINYSKASTLVFDCGILSTASLGTTQVMKIQKTLKI